MIIGESCKLYPVNQKTRRGNLINWCWWKFVLVLWSYEAHTGCLPCINLFGWRFTAGCFSILVSSANHLDSWDHEIYPDPKNVDPHQTSVPSKAICADHFTFCTCFATVEWQKCSCQVDMRFSGPSTQKTCQQNLSNIFKLLH